jgi:hypothetical protein
MIPFFTLHKGRKEKYLRSEENFCTVKNIFSYGRKEIFVRSQ